MSAILVLWGAWQHLGLQGTSAFSKKFRWSALTNLLQWSYTWIHRAPLGPTWIRRAWRTLPRALVPARSTGSQESPSRPSSMPPLSPILSPSLCHTAPAKSSSNVSGTWFNLWYFILNLCAFHNFYAVLTVKICLGNMRIQNHESFSRMENILYKIYEN